MRDPDNDMIWLISLRAIILLFLTNHTQIDNQREKIINRKFSHNVHNSTLMIYFLYTNEPELF